MALFLLTVYIFTVTSSKSSGCDVDWSTRDADSMTSRDILTYFAWGNQSSCQISHDFGGVIQQSIDGIDGQKALCLDKGVELRENCTVYSFGINYDWSFDEAMEKMGCFVFSFDPSMNETDHRHSELVHFYRLGLHDRDQDAGKNGWKMRTLSSIYERLKTYHGDMIDYLKIDIEGDEWHVIPHMIRSGMLSKIRQMGVEIHLNSRFNYTMEEIRNFVRIIQSLERNGMVRFDSKPNPWSDYCLEAFGFCEKSCFELAWYNRAVRQ